MSFFCVDQIPLVWKIFLGVSITFISFRNAWRDLHNTKCIYYGILYKKVQNILNIFVYICVSIFMYLSIHMCTQIYVWVTQYMEEYTEHLKGDKKEDDK